MKIAKKYFFVLAIPYLSVHAMQNPAQQAPSAVNQSIRTFTQVQINDLLQRARQQENQNIREAFEEYNRTCEQARQKCVQRIMQGPVRQIAASPAAIRIQPAAPVAQPAHVTTSPAAMQTLQANTTPVYEQKKRSSTLIKCPDCGKECHNGGAYGRHRSTSMNCKAIRAHKAAQNATVIQQPYVATTATTITQQSAAQAPEQTNKRQRDSSQMPAASADDAITPSAKKPASEDSVMNDLPDDNPDYAE